MSTRQNIGQWGVYCEEGNAVLKWCVIKDNNWHGIYHYGSGYTLEVSNCKVYDNQMDGVYINESVLQIKNSLIYRNGSGGTPFNSYYGINIKNPSSYPEIINNTIIYNVNEGIRFIDNDADPNDVPDIRNSIVYYNGGDSQIGELVPDDVASFSCIEDCNEVNGNINAEPDFAYGNDPNVHILADNYHLAYNSPCVDSGDPDDDYDDVGLNDFDNEDRIFNSRVDIGADEVYSCDNDLSEDDVYNLYDINSDGIVNMEEFNMFSVAWDTYDPNHHLCDPNDPDYVEDVNDPDYISENDKLRFDRMCDLNDDLTIGMADMILFAGEWLWTACWKKSQDESEDVLAMGSEMMMIPMGMFVEFEPAPAEIDEEGLIDLLIGLNLMIDDINQDGNPSDVDMDALYDIKNEVEDDLRATK